MCILQKNSLNSFISDLFSQLISMATLAQPYGFKVEFNKKMDKQ